MTESSLRGSLRSALWLTFFVAIGWVICFWPSRILREPEGVMWMSVAAVSCLVPGWMVVILAGLSVLKNELAAMMLQTMVRLFTVATVAILVRRFRPDLGFSGFFGWLVFFYLLTLAVEVFLLKRKVGAAPQD